MGELPQNRVAGSLYMVGSAESSSSSPLRVLSTVRRALGPSKLTENDEAGFYAAHTTHRAEAGQQQCSSRADHSNTAVFVAQQQCTGSLQKPCVEHLTGWSWRGPVQSDQAVVSDAQFWQGDWFPAADSLQSQASSLTSGNCSDHLTTRQGACGARPGSSAGLTLEQAYLAANTAPTVTQSSIHLPTAAFGFNHSPHYVPILLRLAEAGPVRVPSRRTSLHSLFPAGSKAHLAASAEPVKLRPDGGFSAFAAGNSPNAFDEGWLDSKVPDLDDLDLVADEDDLMLHAASQLPLMACAPEQDGLVPSACAALPPVVCLGEENLESPAVRDRNMATLRQPLAACTGRVASAMHQAAMSASAPCNTASALEPHSAIASGWPASHRRKRSSAGTGSCLCSPVTDSCSSFGDSPASPCPCRQRPLRGAGRGLDGSSSWGSSSVLTSLGACQHRASTRRSPPLRSHSTPDLRTVQTTHKLQEARSCRLPSKLSSEFGVGGPAGSQQDWDVGPSRRKRLPTCDLADLRAGGYLDMPIADAAKALGMSLSSLKNLAHKQGVHRWPYRSRQSLRMIIEQTKQHVKENGLVLESGHQMQQLLDALEEELEQVGMADTPCLSATTKRFRQMVFKLNHTRKLVPGVQASVPASVIEAMAAAVRRP